MKITMIGRKVTLKDSFKEFAQKKLSKLDKFFGEDADATVTVTVEKNHQRVEVTVRDMGMVFRAEQIADDMKDAIEAVVDILVRQIRKNKTKLEKRTHAEGFSRSEFFGSDEEENNYEIVRTKHISVKPMDVEEAILQMEMVGHMFYMFEDASSGDINVVYKRNDGKYGLLESVRK